MKQQQTLEDVGGEDNRHDENKSHRIKHRH